MTVPSWRSLRRVLETGAFEVGIDGQPLTMANILTRKR
jgi:hypothetical protein